MTDRHDARPSAGLAVRTAALGERTDLAGVLVEAFDRDPLGRWLYPDGERRRASHLAFFEEVMADDRPGVIVETTAERDAVAVWYPPGTALDLDGPTDAASAAVEFFDRVGRAQPPGPFWYLAFLGTRVSGRGGGSALLRHRLAETGGTTALWTANERNLVFYGRFGYAPVASASVEGARAWWMTRPADAPPG